MSQEPPKTLPRIAPYALPSRADLPEVMRARFTPEPARLAILVHDMQRYFCAPYAPEQAPLAPMLTQISAVLTLARARGIPVFYTAQEVRQDRRDRGLQAELWGAGMQDPELHRPILPQIAPQAGDVVLTKHRYSAFQRSSLAEMMAARGRDQLAICGLYAHIGCLLTAAEAFMRDIEPFLLADALADFSREKHLMALEYAAATCATPLMTEDFLEALA